MPKKRKLKFTKRQKKIHKKHIKNLRDSKDLDNAFAEMANKRLSKMLDTKHEDFVELKKPKKIKCCYPKCNKKAVIGDTFCKKHGGRKKLPKKGLIPGDVVSKLPAALVGKYKQEYCMRLIQLCKQGYSLAEVADTFGVSQGTLESWAEKYEDFATAYEIAASSYEAWWLREGKANLDNRAYNTALYKFLTGNQLGYSDKKESKNLNVNAGVLVVPGQQDLNEWEQNAKKN